MVEDILCDLCGNFYNVNGYYGCPYCPDKFDEMKARIKQLETELGKAHDLLKEVIEMERRMGWKLSVVAYIKEYLRIP